MPIFSIKSKFYHFNACKNLDNAPNWTPFQLVSPSNFIDLIRIFTLDFIFASIDQRVENHGYILGIDL
jgi:hypothetical protein